MVELCYYYYCRLAYFFLWDVRDRVVFNSLNVVLPTELSRIGYNTIRFRFGSRVLSLQQTVALALGQCVTRGVFLGFHVFVYQGFLYRRGRFQNTPSIRPVNHRNKIYMCFRNEAINVFVQLFIGQTIIQYCIVGTRPRSFRICRCTKYEVN